MFKIAIGDAGEIHESSEPRRSAQPAGMVQRDPVTARLMAAPYRRQYP